MSHATLQKTLHTNIFVSFPGVKEHGERKRKEAIVFLALNEKGSLKQIRMITRSEALRLKFTLQKEEQPFAEYAMKATATELELSHKLKIVQQKNEHEHTYMLVQTEKEQTPFRRKKKRKSELVVTEHMLFTVIQPSENKPRTHAVKANGTSTRNQVLKQQQRGWLRKLPIQLFQQETMPNFSMRSFEEVTVLRPIVWPFLGPGDYITAA
ncbi:hypothetical protein MUG87_02390 [Ectobacillus sp. JY-23]|uniref:hypothetical protein n=1 Tax=Ectobacillus sp. JY-23 TaxID=2933872 RepID=UPI001FF5F2DE|nr:hypothetical protein [Ectobacillus sp. JY-23]UOY93007.1 hypothetical protein MUG87_02390 [Ectobacillus sp. JY-23]